MRVPMKSTRMAHAPRVKADDAGRSARAPDGPNDAGLVFRGLVPFTMVDFPGKLAVTVYTMGCNFRCPICHNRELALSLGDGLPEYDVAAVLDIVRGHGGWIEGVCVTGGEPLIQKGLSAALKRFRDEGLAVKLDTNGSFPDHLEEILKAGLVDHVAMDVKAPLTEEEYSKSAGVSVEKWLPRVEASIEAIKRSGIDHEFRTICLPGLHSPEAVGEIARAISPCRRYVLRPFRPVNTLDPDYEKMASPSPEQMRAFLDAAWEHVPEAVVG